MKTLAKSLSILVVVYGVFTGLPILAQGQDSTTAERDILILAELLPGLYNNANQSYFDIRLKVDEDKRHAFVSREISRLENSNFEGFSFLVLGGSDSKKTPTAVISFNVDYEHNAVRMKTFSVDGVSNVKSARYAKGCDLLWRQEAGQFRGRANGMLCSKKADVARDMMLSKDEVDDHFALDRARIFSCYVDLPGVGGGRDIPFKRYQISDVHDLGGEKWVTTDDRQQIGINLFRVMWTFNNLKGVFTRPSFVVYIKTKEDGAEAKEISYAWAEPTAQRIGVNLK